MKFINKLVLLIISLKNYIIYKIIYFNKMSMFPINSIRGKFKIELKKNSKLNIGKFVMSQGPLYLKCLEGAKLNIGNNVFFNHNCSITSAEDIFIGNECMFANNVVIVDHDHLFSNKGVEGSLVSKPIYIEDNVWCGANVTITRGVRIGKGAIIGANSVVVKDVKSHTIVAGTPAKEIKSINI